MFKRLQALPAALLIAGALSAGAAFAAGPSTQLSVSGAITTPTVYDLAGLQALPAVTQTVTFNAGNTPQTHTYTGTSLWGIVNGAGIPVNPLIKNDILTRYVVATGTDGYKVVYAMGEIHPDFGNKPDLVAYAETIGGVSSPLSASQGFARTTAVGDVRGGRYVSNVESLDVRTSGSTQVGTGGGVSTQFSVTGAVSSVMSFDMASLLALPSVTQVVGGHTYVGVSFWSLLTSVVGIPVNTGINNDILSKYVVATGSDGYQTLFSLGELNPLFGNQPDLIAYSVDGVDLGANGFARLVVPNDTKAGRWVSNLVNLEVFSAAVTPVPEPSTYALLLAGLGVVGFAAKRRKALAAETPVAA